MKILERNSSDGIPYVLKESEYDIEEEADKMIRVVYSDGKICLGSFYEDLLNSAVAGYITAHRISTLAPIRPLVLSNNN